MPGLYICTQGKKVICVMILLDGMWHFIKQLLIKCAENGRREKNPNLDEQRVGEAFGAVCNGFTNQVMYVFLYQDRLADVK